MERFSHSDWRLSLTPDNFDDIHALISARDTKKALRGIQYLQLVPYDYFSQDRVIPPYNAPATNGDLAVLLYKDFPDYQSGQREALVVSVYGLEELELVKRNGGGNSKMYRVGVMKQLQTGRFDNPHDLIAELEGLDYKKLFYHLWEQISLYLFNLGWDVQFMGLPTDDSWDKANAIKRVDDLIYQGKLRENQLHQLSPILDAIHAQRREYPQKAGYTQMYHTWGKEIWLKDVRSIKADKKLQTAISQLIA